MSHHVLQIKLLISSLIFFPGDVVLNNLSLKQSALDDLQLPVKTVSGYLGEYLVFDIQVVNSKLTIWYI